MRETAFIRQNKEKWASFEESLASDEAKDPDRLSDVFVQITDDLSYARTFYPNRSVRLYLNNITTRIFSNIYKSKKERLKKFMGFWREELPLLMYQTRKEMRISLLVFLFSAFLGVLSAANDPDFCRSILGDSYVSMTKENIRKGDPMAVYKKSGEFDMFLGITINNIMVALRTFVTGILFAVGTLFILLYNGIMIGCFQYFFYERGLFAESFLTIWMHGTLEISAIIIAGGAGLVMGRGLLFPGTLSRFKAFQLSARRGLRVMAGIIPIIIFAALIESVLTRYTELPDAVRLLFILTSLAFVLFYFVWLPRAVHRKGVKVNLFEHRLPPARPLNIRFDRVKSVGETFKDAFLLYGKYIGKFFRIALPLAVVQTALLTFLATDPYPYGRGFGNIFLRLFRRLYMYFDYEEYPFLFFLNTVTLAIMIFTAYKLILSEHRKEPVRLGFKTYLLCILFGVVISVFLFMPVGLALLFYTVAAPVFMTALFVLFFEKKAVFESFGRTFALMRKGGIRLYGIFFLLLFMGLLLFLISNSPIVGFWKEVVELNLSLNAALIDKITEAVTNFAASLAIYMIFPSIALGCGLMFFNLREVNDAYSLKQRAATIGLKESEKKRQVKSAP